MYQKNCYRNIWYHRNWKNNDQIGTIEVTIKNCIIKIGTAAAGTTNTIFFNSCCCFTSKNNFTKQFFIPYLSTTKNVTHSPCLTTCTTMTVHWIFWKTCFRSNYGSLCAFTKKLCFFFVKMIQYLKIFIENRRNVKFKHTELFILLSFPVIFHLLCYKTDHSLYIYNLFLINIKIKEYIHFIIFINWVINSHLINEHFFPNNFQSTTQLIVKSKNSSDELLIH